MRRPKSSLASYINYFPLIVIINLVPLEWTLISGGQYQQSQQELPLDDIVQPVGETKHGMAAVLVVLNGGSCLSHRLKLHPLVTDLVHSVLVEMALNGRDAI